jgi:ubiquinone/menaquinone biosynthesis C-methylase UbiE
LSGIVWPLPDELQAGELKSCCASLYESPAVRWLLGGRLHPGGEALTLRCAVLAGIGPRSRVLDVAAGAGDSALLLAERIGCEVVGVDFGAAAVEAAEAAARELGIAGRVSFAQADAESLPFADAEFDAVLCECSLCTFPDKRGAVSEMRRVLRPGGSVAISDVTAYPERLPAPLRTAAAQIACVAAALPADGYAELLATAGLTLEASERHDSELAQMAEVAETRLRAARIVAPPQLEPLRQHINAGLALLRLGRRAIADGHLGYALLLARRPPMMPASAGLHL